MKVYIDTLKRTSVTVVRPGTSPNGGSAPGPSPNGGSAPIPSPSGDCAQSTRAGCSGPVVVDLQTRLNRWRASVGMQLIAVDGIFGKDTATAVVQFKQAHNLFPQDGVAGPKSWALLRSRF